MPFFSVNLLIATVTAQLDAHYQDAHLSSSYAWWLIQELTGKSTAQLTATQTISLTPEQEQKLHDWLNQLINQNMPIAYVLGTVPFLDLTITVQPPILIPRHETEEWVANLIEQLAPFKNAQLTILDIGTGSGCIALAIAQALPNATVYAVDINPVALKLAQHNATQHGITNATFILSDLFDQLPHNLKFDIIVSNPPYLAPHELNEIEPSVSGWEDPRALATEDDGLAIIKKIITKAPYYTKLNKELEQQGLPTLLIEIGFKQGQKVLQLMQEASLQQARILKDLQGKDRVVSARGVYDKKQEPAT